MCTLAEQVVVPEAAVSIYKSLIIPVLTSFSVLSIFDNKSGANRLKSIDSRATTVVNIHVDQAHAVSDGKLCEKFAEYFSLLSHEKRTRNNSISLN